MIRTLIHIPLRDNGGRPFTAAAFKEFESQALELAGGWTRETGAVGAWKDGDTVYDDELRVYSIALSSWLQVPAFLKLAEWARVQFAQEAIYVEIAGIPEIIAQP